MKKMELIIDKELVDALEKRLQELEAVNTRKDNDSFDFKGSNERIRRLDMMIASMVSGQYWHKRGGLQDA
jgi:hypothetical protein